MTRRMYSPRGRHCMAVYSILGARRLNRAYPMCYSAMVKEDWLAFLRATGISLSLPEFHELMVHRLEDPSSFRLPRAFDLEFSDPKTDAERAIKALIDQHRRTQVSKLETEVFTQRKRLADSERKLAQKETKAAVESKRIATNKVQQCLGKLALLKDEKRHSNDYRIFPKSYAPIVIVRDGKKVMVPARYLLRQPGAPAFMDDKLSGNYNARRDNLTKFWRNQFGTSHALMLVESFFENVTGQDGQNQVLHFVPQPIGLMHIACLYAEWSDPKTGEKLLSFAAITDEPPAEVAAAGHDRIIVNLRPENVDRWLRPVGRSIDELQEILSDRQTPYYAHQIAA
ncbi:MAG TPA: SOS response-associated peptidase family protein [Steroidobacteraceae bacterium]|nr:SOS response-associated peptidase family protein [Steroidobacteraceae bacterium]